MSSKIRTNPNPNNRPYLRDLEKDHILTREKVGIRNIIRAETGVVEPQGFNLNVYRAGPQHELPNFHPNAPRWGGWVSYNGGRADITVSPGHPGWVGTKYDLSSIFPE